MELNNEADTSKPLSGFRLHRFELRNWGTFDRLIWSITPGGHNALLTGDIGSGKSTIVDAITTLLVRHDRIVYNKAAGAELRERTPYSYIRGAFKNEKSGYSGKSQDVYIRDENTYSVLLGHFCNEHYDQHITLAQVFWIRNGKPDKFFVIATYPLTIKADFSEFGTDIFKLKKRLKQSEGTEVFDTFSEYSNRFRQHFGIRQPEALDLFYQTVSMKSVGNLTDFVRNQMLGKTDIQDKISDLVRSYEELTKAHDAAQRARHQKEMLEPLMQSIARLEVVKEEIGQYNFSLQEVPKWFSLQRITALKERLNDQATQYLKNENDIAALEEALQRDRTLLRQLESQRDGMEVSRLLREITITLEHLEQERTRKEKSARKYEALCSDLGFSAFIDEEVFYKNIKDAREALISAQTRLTEISIGQNHTYVELDKAESEAEELRREIESLLTRKTQIPERNIALRKQIMDGLHLDESEIPYAGELIRVRDDEQSWEGAIERRMHDFGLSMLVPDRLYKDISRYVNEHHLNGRLVYLRVFDRVRRSHVELKPSSLFNKVEVRHDSEFCEWLEAELAERYNYVCCTTLEEFHREPYALTREGQIKSGKVKHEKNDSRSLTDRRNYVLGWSNIEKIKAYQKELEKKEDSISQLNARLAELQREEAALSSKKDALRDLTQFHDFNEIDFKKTIADIQVQLDRKRELEASSQELKTIGEKIERLGEDIREKDRHRGEKQQEKGKLEERIAHNAAFLRYNLNKVRDTTEDPIDTDEEIFADLKSTLLRWNAIEAPVIGFTPVTVGLVATVKEKSNPEDLDKCEKEVLEKVSSPGGLLDRKRNAQSKLEKEIILVMERYREQYQSETTDVDASIESIPDFRRMYEKLVVDDIPRHEERFRKLLKEGTINGILVFQNQLATYEREIEQKIEHINGHLVDISYNTDSYIAIVQEPVPESDIREFKSDLKACLTGIYGETDHYNETKFLQVKKILDRFKGEREEDRRWTERVTDVRQWYTFGASERYQEDHTEKEYYSDSSGKSGGQKEKLAYTILASAIAFQFGLSWDETRSRSFRFVVIDEAFGRGSDESTRYGLRLFRKLNLQLLIVTPLQKINIIEDYIRAVHFVSNPAGQASMVRNITKAEYVREKQEYFARLEETR